MTEYISFPIDLKAADAGKLSGYASVFGNVDHGGDIVMPGAFREASGKNFPMLWQHQIREPVGVAAVQEDAKGLRFEAQLVLEDPNARTALAHVKAGSVRGVSFGYDILDGGSEYTREGRVLKRLRLHEVSLVTVPMNPLARVDSFKSRADLERAARQWGFSQSKAKRLSYAAWPVISSEEPTEELDELIAELKAMNTKLSKGH
jgi:HK97 family phage prohead protease